MLKNWLNKRRKEPTTYLGLSALAYGLMTVFKADGAEEVAQTIQTVAEPLASGDYTNAIVLSIGGIAGMFMSEKGN